MGPPVSVRDTGKGRSLAGHINTPRNKSVRKEEERAEMVAVSATGPDCDSAA